MPKLHVNGVELYYELLGKGEPLLFIHGLGSSTRDWQDQVDFFSKTYQVILVDIRGHGQSDKPPGPYSIPLFAADVAQLLEKLKLSPVHVIGISMGGMIAFQMAIDHPDLLKSLVVVNCNPEFVAKTFKERLKIWQRFVIIRLLGMRKMGKVLSGRLFPKPEHESLRQLFIERWAENDPRAYRDAMRAIVGWSVMERIKDIACPTLALASDKDYTSVAEKQAYVDELSQGSLVVIDDARHALPAEKPHEFNNALFTFLEDLAKSR